MAIPWLAALKVIPWADVIEATPALVKGARRLLKRSQEEAVPEAGSTTSAAPPATLDEALQRLQHSEARIAELQQAQAESAALLESLAEQQARLVEAVELLRQRSRLLLWSHAGLLALLVAGLGWAQLRG